MLDMIRTEAPDVIVLEMIGQSQRSTLTEFRNDAFRAIRRVSVRPVAAALRSRAGQIEIANFLKDVPGAIQTPEQAIEIITTGQVTPLYNAARAAIERIRWENERFAAGVDTQMVPGDVDPMTGIPGEPYEITPDVPVLPTDNPFLHVPEHAAELASPSALKDPRIRKAILAHIRWHVLTYQKCPPLLAAMLKFPPPQQPVGPDDGGSMGKADLKPGEITEGAANSEIGLPKPARPPEPTLQ
jgi:hypothetical protein